MVWFLNGENGRKIEKRPSLSQYDNMKPRADHEVAQDVAAIGGYNQAFVKDAPRTQGRDKALLVALGVDGDVPLEQAAKNAGLTRGVWSNGRSAVINYAGRQRKMPDDGGLGEPKRKFSETFSGVNMMIEHFLGANDNHEIAAKAA